jgi:hypothetical protein
LVSAARQAGGGIIFEKFLKLAKKDFIRTSYLEMVLDKKKG